MKRERERENSIPVVLVDVNDRSVMEKQVNCREVPSQERVSLTEDALTDAFGDHSEHA